MTDRAGGVGGPNNEDWKKQIEAQNRRNYPNIYKYIDAADARVAKANAQSNVVHNVGAAQANRKQSPPKLAGRVRKGAVRAMKQGLKNTRQTVEEGKRALAHSIKELGPISTATILSRGEELKELLAEADRLATIEARIEKDAKDAGVKEPTRRKGIGHFFKKITGKQDRDQVIAEFREKYTEALRAYNQATGASAAAVGLNKTSDEIIKDAEDVFAACRAKLLTTDLDDDGPFRLAGSSKTVGDLMKDFEEGNLDQLKGKLGGCTRDDVCNFIKRLTNRVLVDKYHIDINVQDFPNLRLILGDVMKHSGNNHMDERRLGIAFPNAAGIVHQQEPRPRRAPASEAPPVESKGSEGIKGIPVMVYNQEGIGDYAAGFNEMIDKLLKMEQPDMGGFEQLAAEYPNAEYVISALQMGFYKARTELEKSGSVVSDRSIFTNMFGKEGDFGWDRNAAEVCSKVASDDLFLHQLQKIRPR